MASARRLAISALAALGVLSARGASANPADTFGLGSRSTALGGAVSARVSDFSASYYNPSGLVLAPATDVSVGYLYVAHSLSMNGNDSRIDPVRGLVGGLVAPGTLLELPFAFGITTLLSDERISRARTLRQDEPRWALYDNRSQLLYLSANLAILPVPWLSLGGGITFLAATRGAFNVRGTADLPTGQDPTRQYDSPLRHEVDADLTAVRYGQFGATVKPDDQLAFALVHRMRAQIDLEIDADLRGKVNLSGIEFPAAYTLRSHTVNGFIPAQWVLGGAYTPSERLSFGLDVVWVQWSAYQSPVSRSTTTLDVGAAGKLVELPPNPKPTLILDPAFHDVIVPRVGVEYRLGISPKLDVPLRVGYVYERSPVPDQTGVTNFVDTDRHLLSFGTGLLWKHPGEVLAGNLRFDLHTQLSVLPTRVTLKDNAADYAGDYRARGTILNVGATLSVGF